jgi:acyl carrier protein
MFVPGSESIERTKATAEEVAIIVRELLAELGTFGATTKSITAETAFDRDLGFDSLARAELFARIGRRLGVVLPESALAELENIGELLQYIENNQAEVSTKQKLQPQEYPQAHFPETQFQPIDMGNPIDCATLQEVLVWRARNNGNTPAIHLLNEFGNPTVITFSDLLNKARGLASGLQSRGLPPRSVIALMLPTGEEYFVAFMGVLLAGYIPVPLYPPSRLSHIHEHLQRHAKILDTSRAEAMIIDQKLEGFADFLKKEVPSLKLISPLAALRSSSPTQRDFTSTAVGESKETAFVQYTSGSTGDPKGVVLTHENLLANIRAMGVALQVGPSDVFASWLPLYHDMGLIGAWLGSLYYGIPLVIMSPMTFLNRPEKWLWAIHNYRATLTAAPNFAFEVCARRIQDADIVGLKLHSMRAALNGSEPVSPDTIDRFTARFSAHGFRAEAMLPVYGLAESSVGLAFPPLDRGALVDRINREQFSRFGRAVPATREDTTALCIISCGLPLQGHEIRIVDNAGRKVPDRTEGTIHFRGPSATQGYLNRPEATTKLFHDDWLDTGDRGYFSGGEVYVTGRVKDMIIRGGHNIYPHELENAVASVAGVRKGCVVAFGIPDKKTGTEHLVTIAETRETDGEKKNQLVEDIQKSLVNLTGEPADHVLLVPPHTVLKTSSGKIRRSACRERFLKGELVASNLSPAIQVLQLYGGQVRDRSINALKACFTFLRSAAAWATAALAIVPGILILALPLPVHTRWGIIRKILHNTLQLMGIPVLLENADHINLATPGSIFVANHQSYLDAFVLMSVFPYPVHFVAKEELSHIGLIKFILKKLGVIFIERFDASKGVQDTRKLVQTAAHGQSLLIFPEGTFTGSQNILPFHLGAFLTAAETAKPVVPLIIQGTRSILPPESWLFHPGPVVIRAEKALNPGAQGSEEHSLSKWDLAVKLRNSAKATIGLVHA